MKKFLIAILLSISFLACTENKLEIIPNYDFQYVEVPDYIRFTNNLIPKVTQKQMSEDVGSLFNRLKNKKSSDPIQYKYELLIGENGKVEKVEMPIISNKTFNENFLEKIGKWNFGKYVVDGKAKKYRLPLTVMSITRNGKVSSFILGNRGEVFNESLYYIAVEEMPSPIGGVSEIQKNIVYPAKAKNAGIEGRVYVKAFIDSIGKVAKTDIIKGIGYGCDEAAKNAVNNVSFVPGKQRGKNVNTIVTIPILFRLQ